MRIVLRVGRWCATAWEEAAAEWKATAEDIVGPAITPPCLEAAAEWSGRREAVARAGVCSHAPGAKASAECRARPTNPAASMLSRAISRVFSPTLLVYQEVDPCVYTRMRGRRDMARLSMLKKGRFWADASRSRCVVKSRQLSP